MVFPLFGSGCLGGTTAQPAKSADHLQLAEQSAAQQDWPQARESAVAFWVTSCKKSPPNPHDCATARLLRGQAELATDAPETAFLSLDWALKNGAPDARDKAAQELERAKAGVQTLLEKNPGMAWLVVEEDFDDNYKFGPERAAYTLDGQPLGEVNGQQTFAMREHRVVAKAIAPGAHHLGVEIHWKGQGTFDNYFWSSFVPYDFDALEGTAIVASLEVTYNGGGPSNKSIEQTVQVTKLP